MHTLEQVISFTLDFNLGDYDFYTLKGLKIAESRQNVVSLLPSYSWNGSSVIGWIIETKNTLRASALHDFLYQIGLHPKIKDKYSRWDADMEYLKNIHWTAHLLYGVGLVSFGGLFFGKGESLIIKNR